MPIVKYYTAQVCLAQGIAVFHLQVQQGLEIRGFWFQKKTVQRKTVLREVYTYVLNEIFFSKNSVSSRLLFKIRVP